MLPFIDDAKKQVLDAFNAWKTDWTQGRAVKLDNLDVPISSRARLPLHEEYEIQQTDYIEFTKNPLGVLDVTGEAVLIGYEISVSNQSSGITIKTSVDGVLMYNIKHEGFDQAQGTWSIYRIPVSFDDLFLFNLYAAPAPAELLYPSKNTVTSMGGTPVLVKPPISKNRLIVEVSRASGAENAGIIIYYGVKK